ncbi:MAG TPA: hypothetical protein VMF67_03815 [Rhizomicrobium sp.]|nr:hypothetical protein [Rhizomicrobium sp.]
MKPWLSIAAILVATIAWSSLGATQGQLPTEQQAQAHCPNDTVVGLNLPTGINHFKGMRWYGATRRGAYVCQKEADKTGNRATRNGA